MPRHPSIAPHRAVPLLAPGNKHLQGQRFADQSPQRLDLEHRALAIQETGLPRRRVELRHHLPAGILAAYVVLSLVEHECAIGLGLTNGVKTPPQLGPGADLSPWLLRVCRGKRVSSLQSIQDQHHVDTLLPDRSHFGANEAKHRKDHGSATQTVNATAFRLTSPAHSLTDAPIHLCGPCTQYPPWLGVGLLPGFVGDELTAHAATLNATTSASTTTHVQRVSLFQAVMFDSSLFVVPDHVYGHRKLCTCLSYGNVGV
jgi:hypothetical protein